MESTTKLTFLGTAAANFLPQLKDECKYRFDKNARRSSCLMIGEKYLVDCGMYCIESMSIAGTDISKITDIFLTHTHADHFIAEHAEMIAEGKSSSVNLWCRRDCELPPMKNINVIRMNFGEEYTVTEGFTVFAVDANHDNSSFPQHFVFNINGKKLMYATDGGWVLCQSYNRLKNTELDALIIDATCGDYNGDSRVAEHNSIPMIRMLVPTLKKVKIIKNDTKIYLTHIAPKLHAPHEEIQKSVDADGFIVAYDGMVTEL